jgi:MFS transporter, FHS family, L-fucose permease
MNTTATTNNKSNLPIPTNYGALGTLVTVFFFWGFIAAGNSVFIPFCKHFFHLDQFQSQLIDFAFYMAYYIGALVLFAYSDLSGKDLIGQWGYKKSIVYGLLFSALGAAAMIVAVKGNSFAGMLIGLFIVALGFSLQQTAAQPFAIALGDPSTGNTRVNLGGGVNSLGTTIGPLVVALALFGSAKAVCDQDIANLPLNKVINLYIFVGILFIGAAALFGFSKKVPSGKSEEKPEKAKKALSAMLIISGLLILVFVPVFSSYKSEGVAKITAIEASIDNEKKEIANLECSITGKTAEEKTIIFSEIAKLKEKISPQFAEIDIIKKPLERNRLFWLMGALALIVTVYPFVIPSLKKRKKAGVRCNTLNWYWVCSASLCM